MIQYGDVPDPTPGPGEVLLQGKACALNHLDIWVRRGWPGLKLEMPHWGSADVAGLIAGLGAGGGVNSVATQIAKLTGATVYDEASLRSHWGESQRVHL